MLCYRGLSRTNWRSFRRYLHPSRSGSEIGSSIDAAEIAKFDEQAQRWWDPSGHAAPLHRLNPVRLAVIRAAIEKRMTDLGVASLRSSTQTGSPDKSSPKDAVSSRRPLTGVSVVDIGCGGGLVTEPLARLGADTLGVDMAVEGIEVAKSHMHLDPALANSGNLRYQVAAVEHLAKEKNVFDVVLALEIVEHVAQPGQFLQDCAALVKPGGVFILSTLNRTAASYALGIIAAERVLRWLPAGTHDWTRFLTPEEITNSLESESNMTCDHPIGLSFNPATNAFFISDDVSVNYMLTASKSLLRQSNLGAAGKPPTP
jgi:2-polyprenyl-6-hydroxyphenyl methylase / 3-demethylubiquinone-9 3-methyltransferase